MPLTYIEAMRRIQQNSVDALKVAQDVHVSGLRATRETAAQNDITDIAFAFGYRLLAAQASYAKQMVDTLSRVAPTRDSATPPPAASPEPVATSTIAEATSPAGAVDVYPVEPAVTADIAEATAEITAEATALTIQASSAAAVERLPTVSEVVEAATGQDEANRSVDVRPPSAPSTSRNGMPPKRTGKSKGR